MSERVELRSFLTSPRPTTEALGLTSLLLEFQSSSGFSSSSQPDRANSSSKRRIRGIGKRAKARLNLLWLIVL